MPVGQEFQNSKPHHIVYVAYPDPQSKLSFGAQPGPNDIPAAILRPKTP